MKPMTSEAHKKEGDLLERLRIASPPAFPMGVLCNEAADEINRIREENERLKAALEDANREARILAQSMWEQSYPHVTEWRMLEDTAGIITQISNMAAGIRDRATAAEAEVKRLREALEPHIAQYKLLANFAGSTRISAVKDGKRVRVNKNQAIIDECEAAIGHIRAALSPSPDAQPNSSQA